MRTAFGMLIAACALALACSPSLSFGTGVGGSAASTGAGPAGTDASTTTNSSSTSGTGGATSGTVGSTTSAGGSTSSAGGSTSSVGGSMSCTGGSMAATSGTGGGAASSSAASSGGMPVCGNGITEAGEECDDMNLSDADDCAQCKLQRVVSACTGARHACAILNDGRVKCWGYNQFGQLGIGAALSEVVGDEPTETGAALPSVNLTPAKQVVCGENHTCALLVDGTVQCWGNNGVYEVGVEKDYSMLQQATTPAGVVNLGTGLTIDHLTAGSGHTCARFTNGTAKCWGFNLYGQLGIDDNLVRGGPGTMGNVLPFVKMNGAFIEKISAGNFHTCALLTGGAVRCWGFNSKGELGTDDVAVRGDKAGSMALVVDIPLGLPAVDVGAGGETTCATLQGGNVKCWGWNSAGQLGMGQSPQSVVAWGDEAGEMAQLQPVNLGGTVDMLAVGIDHECVHLTSGGVKCWGDNYEGVAGQGNKLLLGIAPGDIAASPPIDFGTSAPVLLLPGRGFAFNCALLADGALRCWGYNNYGQLGIGSLNSIGNDPSEMGANLQHTKLFSSVW